MSSRESRAGVLLETWEAWQVDGRVLEELCPVLGPLRCGLAIALEVLFLSVPCWKIVKSVVSHESGVVCEEGCKKESVGFMKGGKIIDFVATMVDEC